MSGTARLIHGLRQAYASALLEGEHDQLVWCLGRMATWVRWKVAEHTGLAGQVHGGGAPPRTPVREALLPDAENSRRRILRFEVAAAALVEIQADCDRLRRLDAARRAADIDAVD
jgi:hypothetical protein